MTDARYPIDTGRARMASSADSKAMQFYFHDLASIISNTCAKVSGLGLHPGLAKATAAKNTKGGRHDLPAPFGST
jgi:hypothetical protein